MHWHCPPCFTSHNLNGLTCEVEREDGAAAGGPGEDLHGGLHEGRLGLGGLLGGGGGHEGGQHEEAGGGHGGGGWTSGHGGEWRGTGVRNTPTLSTKTPGDGAPDMEPVFLLFIFTLGFIIGKI